MYRRVIVTTDSGQRLYSIRPKDKSIQNHRHEWQSWLSVAGREIKMECWRVHYIVNADDVVSVEVY